MHPRVLIVGTVPYNTKSTSRAFDAYFHNWEKENIAQVFSNTKKPCKGHCGTLFQITDYRILQRWQGKKIETGKAFYYDELEDEWVDNDLEIGNDTAESAYKIGRKHTPLTHLFRGLLWRKRFWCTNELNNWLDDFQPECVFLAFSDDYFIPHIAAYIANRFQIPLVSCIGDDYYFNYAFSLNPFYHLYKLTYRHTIAKLLSWPGSAIYISDKIRDKYNDEFHLSGETVYLSSEIQRKPFSPINTKCPRITYFGNIRMGRNKSLNDIGFALGQICQDYVLDIYSNEQDKSYYSLFCNNPHIRFNGSIPYSQVKKKMVESDLVIIVEGFDARDINLSRYSLSTKAADALACGASILSYGSIESGIIDYMKTTGASVVCCRKEELEKSISTLFDNPELQKSLYDRAVYVTKIHHNRAASCSVSEEIINRSIRMMKKEENNIWEMI